MKKILFVHRSLTCGGVETALLDLCSMLDKTKYEVTVMEYTEWNNILKPQFIDAGIRVISPYYKLKPGKNIVHKLYNVICQSYIARRIRNHEIVIREKFDMIVYYQITDVYVKCLSNPAVISYIHGDVGTNKEYRESVLKLKGKIEKSDKIICVSYRATKALNEFVGIKENTISLFNTINSEKILSRSNEIISERFERPYICAVGRLAPEKRFDMLVHIHKNLLNRGIQHDLVIVGEGDERKKIESVICETKTENSVHLLGFKENPYPYMKKSLFTVCSSETEGLPVISMESLLLGKPIVSSFPVVGELFGDEECGLITEMDIKSLEEGIYKMLSNRIFYEKCVEGAKQRSAFFDSKQMIKRVEQIFDDILEKDCSK